MQVNKGIRYGAGDWKGEAGGQDDEAAGGRPAKQARTPLTQAGPVRHFAGLGLQGAGPARTHPREGLSASSSSSSWDGRERKGEPGPSIDTPVLSRGVKRKADEASLPVTAVPVDPAVVAARVGQAIDKYLDQHPPSSWRPTSALATFVSTLARKACGFSGAEALELARQLVTRLAGDPLDTGRATAVVTGLVAEAGGACEGQATAPFQALVVGAVRGWCGSVAHLETGCAQAVLRPLGQLAQLVEGREAEVRTTCARLTREALQALQVHEQSAELQREAVAALLPPDDGVPAPQGRLQLPALRALLQALPGPGGSLSMKHLDLLLDHLLPEDPPRRFSERALQGAVALLLDAVGQDPVLGKRLAGRVLGSRWTQGLTGDMVVKGLLARLPDLAPGADWSAVAAGRLVPSLLVLAVDRGTLLATARAIAAGLAGPLGQALGPAHLRAMVVGLMGYLAHYPLPGVDVRAVATAVQGSLLKAAPASYDAVMQGLVLSGGQPVAPLSLDLEAVRDAWRVLDHQGRPQVMVGLLRQVATTALAPAPKRELLQSLVDASLEGHDVPQEVLAQWLGILLGCNLPEADRGHLAAGLLGAAADRPDAKLPWQWLQRARPAIAMALAEEAPGTRRDALTQVLATAYVRVDLADGGFRAQDWVRRELRFLDRSQALGLLPLQAMAQARTTLDGWRRVLRAEETVLAKKG